MGGTWGRPEAAPLSRGGGRVAPNPLRSLRYDLWPAGESPTDALGAPSSGPLPPGTGGTRSVPAVDLSAAEAPATPGPAVVVDVRVSVIVAPGSGADELGRCLNSLSAQHPGTPRFEVLLAISAGTAASPPAPGAPGLEVRGFDAGPGPVGAWWNRGAAAARGEILLFMRSDTIPNSDLIMRHLDLHTGVSPVAVVGRVMEAGEEELLKRVAERGREPSPAECEGDTFSVSREGFQRAGGFSTDLVWGGAIELAFRLRAKGVVLRRTSGAVARPGHLSASRDTAAARMAAGRGSVELYLHTPALLPFLELGAFQDAGPSAVLLRRLLLGLGGPPLPRILDTIFPAGRWRDRWRRFGYDYHFWRGASRAVVQRSMWRSLVRAPVILMYHAIGGPSEAAGCYLVPVRRFARQMAYLAAGKYRVISLHQLLEYRRRFELPPARSVVITFDDGYADNHELAYPILRARGFQATFFLVSGCIGGRNTWDSAGELAGRPIVSWEAARQLVNGSMEIGAHSRRHRVLPDLSPAERSDEIGGSRRDLEEGLRCAVSTFAYPFGRLDEATTAEVGRTGFGAACCSRSGANDPAVPDLLLRRLEIRGTDSLVRFAFALHRGRTLARKTTA